MMKRFAAEAFGTFALVLVGTGAVCLNDSLDGWLGNFGISLAFGGVVMGMIWLLGKISGAHINPAVTVGFLVARQISGRTASGYIVSQLIGAVIASLLLRLIFPAHETLGATLPTVHWAAAFLLEFALTFALMYVILMVSEVSQPKLWQVAALIGAVVGIEAFLAGPLTGASMNPARSIAPAVVSLQLQHLWIYVVATTLGAWGAVAVCKTVHVKGCCQGTC